MKKLDNILHKAIFFSFNNYWSLCLRLQSNHKSYKCQPPTPLSDRQWGKLTITCYSISFLFHSSYKTELLAKQTDNQFSLVNRNYDLSLKLKNYKAAALIT